MEQIIIKPIHVLQSDPNSVSSTNTVDIPSCELPKFFETNENRSQQIVSRLKQIEKRVNDEVESSKQMQNEDEKPSVEFAEELKKVLNQKIQELKDKTIIQMDFILVSEILQNLAKSEENLLNFVHLSIDNHNQLNEEDDEENEEPKITNGILKKPIAKMEHQDPAKRKKIPYKAVSVLKQWLFENIQDPYPSNEVKEELAKKTGLTFKQVHNWFINARGRIWKKMVNPERFGNVVEKLYKQNMANNNVKK